jgi:tetratricopeptide (TPR) repeat protein
MKFLNRSKKSTKQTLVHLDYEITHEALPHESIKQLPLPVQERVKELYNLARTQPQQAISPLLDMIEKYPMVPVFYNYLRIAYEMTGQLEKADALLEVIYRKFPDYLFAKTNYAFRCLRMGRLEKIPEIFNRKFDLDLLYPHRVVFHLSEFTAFTSVMALYHHVIGDRQNALRHYALLKRWAPNQELTQVVKSQLEPTLLQKLLDQLGMVLSKIFETTEKGVKNQIDALEHTNAAASHRQVQFSKTF